MIIGLENHFCLLFEWPLKTGFTVTVCDLFCQKSTVTFCLNINLYTFLANIALAESMEESADDITAAETEPSPMKATAVGVKYCKTRGRIRFRSLSGIFVEFNPTIVAYSVWFQSEK